MKLVRSAIIDAQADQVWALLRDFSRHADWHPFMASCEAEAGRAGDEVGCVRNARFNDGDLQREQLIRLSDTSRSLTYAIIDAQVPLRNHVATMGLKPVTDTGQTLIEWRVSFDAPKGRRDEFAQSIGDGVCMRGIAGLKEHFRQGKIDEAAALAAPPINTSSRAGREQSVVARAVMADAPGGPDTMRLHDVVVPPPQTGEVRLRQTFAGINFFDIHQRSGRSPLSSYPGILGVEAAGVVDEVGPGVVGIYPGDHVVYANLPAGSFTSMRCVPASWCVPVPSGLPDDVATASLLKGVTSEIVFNHVAPLKEGDLVLVHAAAGGLGSILVQQAKRLGARVIGTVSTAEKARFARDLGCDWPIIRVERSFVDQVLDLSHGRGADVVVDGIGQDTLGESVAALSRFGRLVQLGASSGPPGAVDIGALKEKSASLFCPVFFHYAADSAILRNLASRVFTQVQKGDLKVDIDRTWEMADVVMLHKALEARRTQGLQVMRLD